MATDAPQDPTTGEIDCLAVLWEARDQGIPALKLSKIREGVVKRRALFGEPPPALTTVSTYLRSALAKRLLEEVQLGAGGTVIRRNSVELRGALSRGALAPKRSPKTAYLAAHEPGEVFHRTYKAMVQAYPPKRRHQALIDFAKALGLPQKTLKEVEACLKEKVPIKET